LGEAHEKNVHDSPKVLQFFRRVLQMRGWIVCVFLVLTAAGIYGTTRIPNDPAIDRLVVSGDATARATADFDRLFPEGEQALIMLEGPDPLTPAALRTADQLERDLQKIPGVKAHTLLDFFRRTDPKAEISASEAERLRPFSKRMHIAVPIGSTQETLHVEEDSHLGARSCLSIASRS